MEFSTSLGIPVIVFFAMFLHPTSPQVVLSLFILLTCSFFQVKCSMRFSTMEIEWLLLHIHLLWSGAGIVVLSALSWLKIGSIQQSLGLTAGTTIGGETRHKIRGQRKRLFRIAFHTSVCLLLSLAITIVTGGLLEDWSRSSDIWLRCTVYSQRNWDEYGLKDGDFVCGVNGTSFNSFSGPCVSDCFFDADPEDEWSTITGPGLYCQSSSWGAVPCDCSCDDLVSVERPSLPIMTLGYLAKSMVVVIVGINMGLRLQLQTPLMYKYTFFHTTPVTLVEIEIAYNQERLHKPLEAIFQAA